MEGKIWQARSRSIWTKSRKLIKGTQGKQNSKNQPKSRTFEAKIDSKKAYNINFSSKATFINEATNK